MNLGKIHIDGLRTFAFHGVGENEKRNGQPFELDITLEADLSHACVSDRLEDTVNYAEVAHTALGAMRKGPFNLIERAAEQVAEDILTQFAPVQAVSVTLKKPRAPIAADFKYVSVEIRRIRGSLTGL